VHPRPDFGQDVEEGHAPFVVSMSAAAWVARGEEPMQYMLLIYGDMSAYAELSEEEQATELKRWSDYTEWLGQKGWMRAGDALQPVDQATSVRVQGGERIVTDGPFAETKETLGGYYLIDVDNLDDAIEAAAECPGAQHGTIELRPVMVFEEMPQA
jgi:hypothetical protein